MARLWMVGTLALVLMMPISDAQQIGAGAIDQLVSAVFQIPLARYEILWTIVGLIYAYVMLCGKSKNKAIVKTFEEATVEVFQANFASLGPPEGKCMMTMDGSCTFRMNATGRRNCSSCSVYIDLLKRPDLMSIYIWPLVAQHVLRFGDTCRMEVALDNVDTMSVCICNKVEAEAILLQYPFLQDITKQRKVDALHDMSLCVLADTLEAAEIILKPQVVHVLRACQNALQVIVVSDVLPRADTGSFTQELVDVAFDRPPIQGLSKGISAAFRLDSDGQKDNLEPVVSLIRLTLHLVDVLSMARLSEKSRSAVAETRAEVTAIPRSVAREEMEVMMRVKKLIKQKVEENAVKNMSTEAQRKYEEKQYKKSLKPKYKLMR